MFYALKLGGLSGVIGGLLAGMVYFGLTNFNFEVIDWSAVILSLLVGVGGSVVFSVLLVKSRKSSEDLEVEMDKKAWLAKRKKNKK